MVDENIAAEGPGLGKKIITFAIFMILSVAYYQFLDWFLMGPVQNLPYPYK